MGKEGVVLKNRMHRTLMRWQMIGQFPPEQHFPFVGLIDPRNQFQKCTFTTSASSEQNKHFPSGNGEIDFRKDDATSKATCDAAQFDGR